MTQSISKSSFKVLELKEDAESIILKGYIATTHFDGQDKITKETLDKWCKEINDGNPRSNKVSVNHNRQPHVAGMGIKGTAAVHRFPDFEYGLYVETKIDKTREDFQEIMYRIKEGFLDSYSIEYVAPDDAKIQEGVRILDERTDLYGWTLASQPMNERAVMIKEFYKSHSQVNVEADPNVVKKTSAVDDIHKSDKEAKIMVETKEAPAEVKEQPQEVKEKIVEKTVAYDDSSIKLEMKELKEKMDKMVEQKVMLNKEQPAMKMEVKEYMDIFGDKKLSVKEQFRRAGQMLNAANVGLKEAKEIFSKPAEAREFKNFVCNGNKMEFKNLGITTNQNTDTDYLLTAAELQDVFDPVIYNALNEETNLWNALQKDSKANSGSNRVEFVLKIAQNASASSYLGNDLGTGNTTRIKYVTKFKKYKAEFAVDGDMIAAAKGGPVGDILAQEIEDATYALMSKINVDLFAEVGLETAAAVIGLEYISDATGNTTLYNVTRSAANKLAPDVADANYISGAAGAYKSLLRQGIRYLLKDGSRKQDLLIVCDHIQGDKIKETFDNQLRLNSPQATRFGFETALFFEGVPVLLDKDCNDDDIFIVDTRHHRIAVWVPPTVEMLGKRSDAEEGFIKTYFAVYNTAPRRMVQIYGCPTS